MNLMDRSLQREILERLAESYPESRQPHDLGQDEASRSWNFNASYLHEHGLIKAQSVQMFSEGTRVHLATITAAGLDFLQDDGGLTAVLHVLTIRFDAKTLRAMIEQKIEAASMPPAEKSKLMAWVKSTGEAGLKEAMKRLVGAALDHVPDALRLLQTLHG